MKRDILVPLDGSHLAEAALPHAAALAGATSSGITLLRVVQPLVMAQPMLGAMPVTDTVAEMWEEEPKAARAYLETIAKQLRDQGLEVRVEVEEGYPAFVITEYARENAGISMIAMSTHGRGGLGRWVFGSVAEKVLQGAPKPLLLIRSSEAAEEAENWTTQEVRYRDILVPLDGSELAEQALDLAKSLALSIRAKLLLQSVVTSVSTWVPPEWDTIPVWAENEEAEQARKLDFYLMRMSDELTAQGIDVETQRVWGDPAEEILRASHAHADLIVMATHGRTGLQRLWLGSVAVKVARGSFLPVLLVRAKKVSDELPLDHAATAEAVTK